MMYVLCADNHECGLAEPFLVFDTEEEAKEFQRVLGLFPVYQSTRIVQASMNEWVSVRTKTPITINSAKKPSPTVKVKKSPAQKKADQHK